MAILSSSALAQNLPAKGYAASGLANAILANEVPGRNNAATVPPRDLTQIDAYRQDLFRIQQRLSNIELSNTILDYNNKAVTQLIGAAGGRSKSVDFIAGGMGLLFDYVKQTADKNLERHRVELYSGLFARARNNDLVKFSSQVGSEITPQNYERARKLIEGDAGPLAREMLASRPQDRDAIVQQQIRNLNAGLAKSLALQAAQQNEIDGRVASAEQDIAILQSELDGFEKTVTDELDDLKRGQKALRETTEILGGQTVQNSADIAFMQDVMFGKMSASEQRVALESGGFFRDLEPEKRQRLLDNVRIMEKVETGQRYLTGASQLATLAGKLGLPAEDVANFQANISTAQAAFSLAGSIMTSNWVGALGAASGLLGGGGEDATGAALAQISRQLAAIQGQLREIKALNLQILSELRELRENMLERFDHIDRRLTLMTGLINRSALSSIKSCQNFTSTMALPNYDAKAGVFRDYDARRRHFADHRADYQSCLSGLHSILASLAPKFDPLLESAGLEGSFGDAGTLRTPSYPALYRLTLNALGASTSNADECIGRTYSVLMMFQARGSSAANLTCEQPLLENVKPYTSITNQLVDANAVLSRELYVPLLLEVGNDLIQLAPYRDFVVAEGLLLRLRTLDELRTENPGQSLIDTAALLSAVGDVVNGAIAQQVMQSGAPIANWIATSTADIGFGSDFGLLRPVLSATSNISIWPPDSAQRSMEKLQDAQRVYDKRRACLSNSSTCQASLSECAFDDNVLTALCLLGKSFELRKNVGQSISRSIVSGTSRLQYAAALASGDPGFMRELIRRAGINWLDDATPEFAVSRRQDVRYPDWAIKVRVPGGAVEIPLSIPIEADTTRMTMTPAWYELVRLRDSIDTRRIALTADEAIEHDGGSFADRQFVRELGLYSPSLAYIQ